MGGEAESQNNLETDPSENQSDDSDTSDSGTIESRLKTMESTITNLQTENKALIKENVKRRKALSDRDSAEQQAAEQNLADNNKFKELAEVRGNENAALKARIRDQAMNSALGNVALKLGLKDTIHLDLIPKDTIAFDEENGKVDGAEEAVAKLKTSHPYLFGITKSPVDTQNPADGPKFTNGDSTDYDALENAGVDAINAHFDKLAESKKK